MALTVLVAGQRARFALEAVVEIRATASQPLREARTGVKNEEQHAEALVLAHVHAFVRADRSGRGFVDAEDDVSERDGVEAAASGACPDEPAAASAGHFDDAADKARASAARHRRQRADHAHERRRRRPQVAERVEPTPKPARRHHPSTSISFVRAVAPLRIDTCALRTPKRRATSAITSAFALPSTGDALTHASQVPSPRSSSDDIRAFGLTRTWIFTR